ncbi:hypothetical protein AKO1_001363 [Acrasis kona]|uniref:Uncharacterized protein n=1 Tax=Acrasis kona TaxID=1008807 RepID=A0AAW2ZSK7_9EUKA
MEEASQGRSQDSQIVLFLRTGMLLLTPTWKTKLMYNYGLRIGCEIEVDGPQKKKRRTQTEMENEFAKQQQQRRDVLSNVPLNPTTTNGTVGCDRDSMERCVSNAITKSIPKIALGCIFFMNEWFGLANLAKTGTDNLNTAINDVVNEAISNNKEIYSPGGHKKHRSEVVNGLKAKYSVLLKNKGEFDPAMNKLISDIMKDRKQKEKKKKPSEGEKVAEEFGISEVEWREIAKKYAERKRKEADEESRTDESDKDVESSSDGQLKKCWQHMFISNSNACFLVVTT